MIYVTYPSLRDEQCVLKLNDIIVIIVTNSSLAPLNLYLLLNYLTQVSDIVSIILKVNNFPSDVNGHIDNQILYDCKTK